MILLIDNYDSFSYNLYQYIGEINPDVKVIRNDRMTVEEAISLNPTHIVISPGPGRPSDAGICERLVLAAAGKIPVLGVCLGHQAICEAFGGKITYAKKLMHGKSSIITVEPEGIFAGLSKRLKVARYHSLAADLNALPDCLEVLARADDGEIMAVKHKKAQIYGLQFHPESILTDGGKIILKNFFSVKE